jgi:hypothetical protein
MASFGTSSSVQPNRTYRLSPDASTDCQNRTPRHQQSLRPSVPRPPVIQCSQFPRPPGPSALVPARAAVSFAPSESDFRGAQAVFSLGPRQAHSPLASQARTPEPYLRQLMIGGRLGSTRVTGDCAIDCPISPPFPTAGRRPGHASSTSPTSPLGADPDSGPRLRPRGASSTGGGGDRPTNSPGTLQLASAEHGVWTSQFSCRAKPC